MFKGIYIDKRIVIRKVVFLEVYFLLVYLVYVIAGEFVVACFLFLVDLVWGFVEVVLFVGRGFVLLLRFEGLGILVSSGRYF